MQVYEKSAEMVTQVNQRTQNKELIPVHLHIYRCDGYSEFVDAQLVAQSEVQIFKFIIFLKFVEALQGLSCLALPVT